jgi:hypothetical protein
MFNKAWGRLTPPWLLLPLDPENVQSLVLAGMCFHNMMQITCSYPGLQHAALDREADDHQDVPGV